MTTMPYQIEYYQNAANDEPVRDFIDALPIRAQAKCFNYLNLLNMNGTMLASTHIKKVEGDIWELRPEYGGVEYRLFFGRHKNIFVFVHAITKKRQKLTRGDIALAQKRFDDWKGKHP